MKKRYLIFTALICTMFVPILLLAENTFGKRIDGMEQALSVSPTSDGGIIISGTSQSSDSTIIVKTDENGNEQWRKYFEGFEFSSSERYDNYRTDVKQTVDGGYIFINTIDQIDASVKIQKLNAEGEILWNKIYDNEGDDFSREVLYTNDKGYLFFFSNDSTIYMIKTDSIGNEQWTNIEINIGFIIYDFQIRQTNDNGYIYSRKGDLIKYDLDGAEEWRQGYNGVLRDMVHELTSGGYIIADYKGKVERTDLIGQPVWQSTLESRIDAVTVTADDKIILAGTKLTKLDILSNIIWQKDLPPGIIYDLDSEAGGSIILCGFIDKQSAWFARFGPNGESRYLFFLNPIAGDYFNLGSEIELEFASSGVDRMTLYWQNETMERWQGIEAILNPNGIESYSWSAPWLFSKNTQIKIIAAKQALIEFSGFFTIGAKHYDNIAINEILMYFATDGDGSYDRDRKSVV